MQTSPAIFMDRSTISRAPRFVLSSSATAAHFANGPPEPMAATGLSGLFLVLAAAISASAAAMAWKRPA